MSVSKDLNMIHSDSNEHELTPNSQFPDGTLTVMFGSLSSHKLQTSNTSDKLGQCNANKLKHEKRTMIVTNMHRLPDGSGRGLKTYPSKYNRTIGIKNTERKDRKELLKDAKKFLHEKNE